MFHLTKDKFGHINWLKVLKSELDYAGIAKSVASVVYSQTFDDPHWAADLQNGKPYAYITHPFKTLPAHYDTFSKLKKKSERQSWKNKTPFGGVYINKNGGMQPIDGSLEILEESNCAYWPSNEISGSISKWNGGKHWYISTEGISLERKTGYKEKFDSYEQAKTFLERFIPASSIKTNQNFRDFKIGD